MGGCARHEARGAHSVKRVWCDHARRKCRGARRKVGGAVWCDHARRNCRVARRKVGGGRAHGSRREAQGRSARGRCVPSYHCPTCYRNMMAEMKQRFTGGPRAPLIDVASRDGSVDSIIWLTEFVSKFCFSNGLFICLPRNIFISRFTLSTS
jgi:hypothetical protein